MSNQETQADFETILATMGENPRHLVLVDHETIIKRKMLSIMEAEIELDPANLEYRRAQMAYHEAVLIAKDSKLEELSLKFPDLPKMEVYNLLNEYTDVVSRAADNGPVVAARNNLALVMGKILNRRVVAGRPIDGNSLLETYSWEEITAIFNAIQKGVDPNISAAAK